MLLPVQLDELVKECCQSVNSGEGAVLCKPIPTVTVKNSQLFVKCLVPENLSNCLQISIPDREKVSKQIKFESYRNIGTVYSMICSNVSS